MNQVFVHEQIIRFAHCDPAGIVYFPRFFDLAHTVMEDWFANGVGYSMPEMILRQRIGTPTVTIHCDFAKALRMGDVLRFELRVTRIGRSSVQLDYRGTFQGEEHLHIVQTIAFVDLDAMRSIPIPEHARERIESFLAT
jgi:4-hydroxybenzoyl-CoA thioesterase